MNPGLPNAPWLAVANGAAGLAIVGYGLATWKKVIDTRRWPSVAGTVVGTRVTCHTTSRGGTKYFGHIDYQYAVGAKTFQGNRRLIGGAIPDSEQGAELLCSRYNTGDTVWVFYDPSNPREAVLEHSAAAAWRVTLLGAILLAFAIWFGMSAIA
jgi:hypothetical protein